MNQQKDIKKVATTQKLKHVTSEKQVGYQLSQGKQRNREVQNERAAKATTTINRIDTIRSIFTSEQREHLVMSTGMTQYAFGVEGGDAGKKACASLTAAVTKTMWKDQRRRCKEILLTTLVKGHAIDPTQRACYQSIAMARGRADVEESVSPEPDTGTPHNTPCLVANISRCLQRMEAEWEDAFTICLKDNRTISLIKGEDRKNKQDLTEALGDARLRMITRKDLREDAAKGIDKAASLHMVKSRQRTQWQMGQLRAIHLNGVRTCKALFKSGRLACDVCPACGKEPETQSHMWRGPNEQHAVIRKRFMTEKDEEEMRKESIFTQTTLLLQTNVELITWNEAHRGEDEVCARIAAKELRLATSEAVPE